MAAHRIRLRLRAAPGADVELVSCASHQAVWHHHRSWDSADAQGDSGGLNEDGGGEWLSAGKVLEVDIGDLYADEERAVLVALRVGPLTSGTNVRPISGREHLQPVLEACIDYCDARGPGLRERQRAKLVVEPLMVRRAVRGQDEMGAGVDAGAGDRDEAVDVHLNRLAASRALGAAHTAAAVALAIRH